jgi:UDP-N-acetylmuramate dehydrogenase
MMVLELKKDYDLSKNSTLRVQAQAKIYAEPKSFEDLKELFTLIISQKLNWHILGAGSNTLLSSRGIDGVVICTNKLDFIKDLGDSIFEVGVGTRMPKLCAITAQKSLSGAEFMEGIPGSIGGGIVMNAGAHKSDIASILLSAKVFNTQTLELEDWSKQDLGFEYRKSKINPQEHLIYSGVFKFTPASKETIRAKIQENNHWRTTKQPIKAWTCGCTFKNPEPTVSAGKLIEDLGLKGLCEGDFMVSNMHGNFFENTDSGTSIDFCKLMKKVQSEAIKLGVTLKPEVQLMGEFTDDEKSLWG